MNGWIQEYVNVLSVVGKLNYDFLKQKDEASLRLIRSL